MRTLSPAILLFTSALLSITAHAESKVPATQSMSVDQLQQTLAASHDRADTDVAQQLSTIELTERLNRTQLTRLSGTLPGEKSRQALILLADKSAFLDPPTAEIPVDPTPDTAATRHMLVQIVGYVNTTLRQLPNLIASRETTGFEDRPQEDSLEATGIVSYSYQPLHFVGRSFATVTFRDRKEIVDERSGKGANQGKIGGMITSGEFGPILSVVVADALKGKITWARWERDANERLAVFDYSVPQDKSNYHVKFCCIVNGYNPSGQPDLLPFDEQSAYHGEIAFDPSNGTILRLTIRAELPLHGLVPNAGVVMEYAPFEIGGKNFICPARSISLLEAHTAQPHGMYSKADYKGPAKTFLNDVVFDQYKRFGSETRILAGEDSVPPR
jgi:hypothetical protein